MLKIKVTKQTIINIKTILASLRFLIEMDEFLIF